MAQGASELYTLIDEAFNELRRHKRPPALQALEEESLEGFSAVAERLKEVVERLQQLHRSVKRLAVEPSGRAVDATAAACAGLAEAYTGLLQGLRMLEAVLQAYRFYVLALSPRRPEIGEEAATSLIMLRVYQGLRSVVEGEAEELYGSIAATLRSLLSRGAGGPVHELAESCLRMLEGLRRGLEAELEAVGALLSTC